MHPFLQAFANMLLQKYFGFTSFHAKLQVWFAMFSEDLQAFKIHGPVVLQAFARFCKDLQMDFHKDLQVLKSWFFARIHNGHFADELRKLHPPLFQLHQLRASQVTECLKIKL